MRFVRPTIIKKYVHDKGKRISRGAMLQLDVYVQDMLDRALNNHNGGRTLVDSELIVIANARIFK